VKSFAPICGLTLGAQVVMVKNELPVKTVAELIALAQKEPGKLSFGSGNGSSRGGAELFRIMAKVDLLGVPYKTQPQAIGDLLGGRIDVIFSDFTTGLPPVLDGRARGIAVTSKKPIEGLTQFPPVGQTVPGFEMWAWTAAYVPAGTPRLIVDKLNALVREAMKSETYLMLTRTTYGVPFPGTPEELAAFQAAETKKWGEIVTVAGMKEP
jgi:tripartite-type tricarboxylate transporter receptor subunit TctC